MADKSISELAAASQVGSTDLFVLEQGNVAKKLTGQILENWLVSMADGHGGIQTIEKTGTSGNTDTYTITFADETTSQFTVNNGNGITGMTSSKSGRITTVTFSYSDGTSSSFTISDGEGISKVVSYWAISTSKTTQPSSWQTTPQDMTSTYKYLWSYMRINYTDGTHQDTTPAVVGIYGDKGDPGNTGTSITNVAKISTSGLVDTYRITFSNGTNTTFQVTNGSNIETIELTSTSGLVDTYTVTMTNGATSTFQVTNGKGISSIQMVSGSHAAGTSDTYRITYNDGDTFDFLVYNGANGTGAVSTVAGIGVSGDTGDVPLILWGNSAPTSATVGQLKQLYFDLSGGVMYICVGVAVGSYSWVSMGITVDSALSTTSNNPVRNSVISQKVGTESLSGFTATNLTTAANELKTTKAEKSATVSTIRYNDNDNHKLQKTINGTTTDVMTVDTEPTDGSMNPITSDAAYELKGSLNGKLSLYSMLTESENGIPTDSEIISSIALHEGSGEFAVRFYISSGRSVYTIIWIKLLETLASGLGFGFYEDSGYTLRKYHYNSPNLNTFNYHSNIISAQNTAIKALNDIATYENGTTASRNYSVGQYLIYNGYLYQVISAISSGATLSPGTNITQTNIGDNINIMDVSLNLSSLPSNVTDRGCFCKRFGKLIFLSIDVAITGTSSTSLNNLLPVGCRPRTNVNVVMADGTGNGYVTVLVNGYGSVIIYPKGSGYCQGNLTFITE